jgi:hypothetical protein
VRSEGLDTGNAIASLAITQENSEGPDKKGRHSGGNLDSLARDVVVVNNDGSQMPIAALRGSRGN